MHGSVDGQSIAAIFLRHGAEGRRAKLAANFSSFERDYLLKRAALEPGEEMALGGVDNDPVWWLLTTRRLMWSGPAGVHRVPIADLKRVVHDGSGAMRKGQYDRRLWTDLEIDGPAGRLGTLTLEPGKPFLGAWHVLQWLVRRADKWRRQAA